MTRTIENADSAGHDDVAAEKQSGAYALAVGLAALAGWTDGTAYIKYNGLFVSFMSGNTTKVASTIGFTGSIAFEAGRSIAVFVAGVAIAEIIGALSPRWGRTLVLALETLVLAAAVGFDALRASEIVVASLLGIAMGVQNAAVHKADGISMALTYVTGTLVHIGRGCAAALCGAGPWSAPLPFVGLWCGLFCGGLGGSLTARASPVAAMAAAAGLAALFTAVTLVHRLVWRSTDSDSAI